MALLAAYLFDEASSGTTPTVVADSAPSPVDLSINYASGNWTSISAGNGLAFAGGTSINKTSGLGSSKLGALEGATQLTILMAVDVVGFDTGVVVPFAIENPGVSDGLFIYTDAGAIQGYANDTYIGSVDVSSVSDGHHVIALVFDLANGTTTERFKVYVDGSQLSGISTGGGTIRATNSYVMHLGGTVSTESVGAMYTCLIYDEVLDDTTIGDYSTALLADNDTDPDSGGAFSTSYMFESAGARNLRINPVYRM